MEAVLLLFFTGSILVLVEQMRIYTKAYYLLSDMVLHQSILQEGE